ncbi:MAG: hypothetical protein KBG48_15520 [Kofleriaceae bacterium]|nr:hypothetical protein [Kofleriaceae bacterium]MBP9168806.1 hypothetical protein [Kofleriaceae bacterium]MBP9863369.1 hypothetical protein [Kofleriaceae bacterium]
MSTPTRYDQLVTRNRFRRTRDLIGAAILAALVALAAGALRDAGPAQAEAATSCAPTAPTC